MVEEPIPRRMTDEMVREYGRRMASMRSQADADAFGAWLRQLADEGYDLRGRGEEFAMTVDLYRCGICKWPE